MDAALQAAAPAPEPTPSPVPRPPPPDGVAEFVDELPADAFELAFTGDVNLGRRIGDYIRARGAEYPWQDAAPFLQAADVTVVNLECAISTRGAPLDKEFTFRGDPSSVPAMAAAGVHVASVGNNHAVDFGREAFLDTLEHLRVNDILAVGGGVDADDAYRPRYLETGGRRIGFVAGTRVMPYHFAAGPDLPGVASVYEEERFVDAIRQARSEADLVVVLVHWGVELAREPNSVQVGLGRAFVDAGADIVVGHHPHVLQPVVRYRGAVIAYSLGNFVFTAGSEAGRTTMLLRVGVSPDGSMDVASVPMRIVEGRPVPVGV